MKTLDSFLKITFDILISLFLLILFLPFLIFLSLLIFIDDPGPVLFKQTRVGLNEKDFKILKLRTMKVRQDPDSSLLTTSKRDPRITTVGFYLRKYKLDELPQLVNVLKGEMSLVGPRPEVKKYVDLYDNQQRKVLGVRPGITDLASIKYKNESELLEQSHNPEKLYIETIMPDKIKINLTYIENRNIFKDLGVVIQTIGAIL